MARSAAAKAPTVMRDLQKDMAAAATLKAQLKDILGEDELDADTLKDSIEGETGLFETIDAVLAQIGEDNARIEGIEEYLKKVSGRKSRLDKRVETLRTMLAVTLEILEEKRFERPLATITLKEVAPKLVVVDEAAIPSQFYKTPEPVLSRKELSDALKLRGIALEALEVERKNSGMTTDNQMYRDKLQAIIAAHPPIPGAELGNGGVTVQVRFS